MHIREILKRDKISLSFEFFPPKTPKASDSLFESIRELVPLKPSYVSVTYGAGGSTRELTHELVKKIARQTGLTVVSHLTCVGSTRKELLEILTTYHDSGIDNIMALRGDEPENQTYCIPPGEGFDYACDLVSFIKEHFPEMGIGVAGYPEGHPGTPNRLKEIEYLKQKVDGGADYICTQMFFDNRDFYDFRDRCRFAGIDVPILAGIMPITSKKGMYKMADLAAGMHYPARLLKAVMRAEDDDYVEKVGVHWATEQVDDLISNGVEGIHFYTLNKSRAAKEIYASLGVSNSLGLNK